MSKGYWIARIDVEDPETYKSYVSAATPAYQKYGAKFLVRGGRSHAVEGPGRGRNVVVEFESFDIALACYNSPEYARLVAIRSPHAESELVIIEGYDGAQP